MGAAASHDIQDEDVIMELPPDATDLGPAAAAEVDGHDHTEASAVAKETSPLDSTENSIGRIERDLMAMYDAQIRALEEKEKAALAAAGATVAEGDNAAVSNNLAMVERCLLVSKFYNETQSPLLTKEEIEHEFFAAYQAVTPLDWTDFDVRVDDASSTQWKFSARGNPNTVEVVLRHLQKWIKITKIPLHNFNLTARLGVATPATLDSSLPIGAALMNLKNGSGVFMSKIVEQGELARCIGEKAKYFAIVERLNGQPCPTVEAFRAIKGQTTSSEKLHLVIKCLQPVYSNLLWRYASAEETTVGTVPKEYSPTFTDNANSLTGVALTSSSIQDQTTSPPAMENESKRDTDVPTHDGLTNPDRRRTLFDNEVAQTVTASSISSAQDPTTLPSIATDVSPDGPICCPPETVKKPPRRRIAHEEESLDSSASTSSPKSGARFAQFQKDKVNHCASEDVDGASMSSSLVTNNGSARKRKSLDNIEPNPSCVEDHNVINLLASDDKSETEPENGSPDGKTGKGSRLMMDHNVFNRKHGSLLMAEFKPAGIHKHFATGRSWHYHKIRYSATCPDDCPCSYDLPFLTKNVVSDHIDKYPEWNNVMKLKPGDFPMGLTGSFAGTFMPKLKAQYPSENAVKHLERLESMWTTHQRSNRFGRRCHFNCKCVNHWERLFRFGALEGDAPLDKAAAPIPKKRKIAPTGSFGDEAPTQMRVGCSVSVSSGFASNPTQDQRKGAALELDLPSVSSDLATDPTQDQRKGAALEQDRPTIDKSVASPLQPIQDRQRSSSSTAPTLANVAAASQREPYDIEYDSNSSLGFYCLTERNEGPNYCKVISVFSHEPGPRDPRIQYGTKVLSFEFIKGHRQPIHNHFKLKDGYDKARSTGAVIRVTFDNTNVTSESVLFRSHFFAREWTKDGQWLGKCTTGWDGGAFASQKQKLRHEKFDEILNPVQPRPTGDTSWYTGIRSKKIRFADVHSCRTYNVHGCPQDVSEDVSNEMVTKGDSTKRLLQEKAPRQTTQGKDVEEPDVSVLRLSRLSVKDLLRLIQTGSLKHASVIQWFDHAYMTEIKTEMDRVSSRLKSSPNDRDLQRRARELELMKKALKIAIHADSNARGTKALYSWKKFQVCVKSICGLKESLTVPLANVDVSAKSFASQLEQLPALPRMPFAPQILFGENVPSYNVRDNPDLAEDRKIEFSVYACGRDNVSRYQCKFRVQLSELSSKATQNGKVDYGWRDMVFNAEQWGDCRDAELRLSVCRVPIPPGYVHGKHDDAKASLNDIIDWISRFNDDLADWNRVCNDTIEPIGADIVLRGGGSLLHSAIYLKETSQLERLLELNGGLVRDDCLESAFNLTLKVPSLADDGDREEAETRMDEMSTILDERMKRSRKEPASGMQTTYINEATGTKPARDRTHGTQCDPGATPLDSTIGKKRVRDHTMENSARLPDMSEDLASPLSAARNERRHETVSGSREMCASERVIPADRENTHDTHSTSFNGGTGTKRIRGYESERVVEDVTTCELSRDERRHQGLGSTTVVKSPDFGTKEWLLTHPSSECRSFRIHYGCRKKFCPFVHVHRLTSTGLDEAEKALYVHAKKERMVQLREELRTNPELLKMKSVALKTGHHPNRILWSAAFVAPGEVCYAVGGTAHVSSDNVSWYLKESDAVDALLRTVIVSQTARMCHHKPTDFVSPGAYYSPGHHKKSRDDR